MLTKRIIPCLDVKDGRVVKGVSFVNLRDAGDPVEVATVYDREGADELFGGYLTYLADDYAETARKTPAVMRRAALAAMKLWPVSDDKISFEYKVKRFLRGSLLRAEARSQQLASVPSDPTIPVIPAAF